MFPTLLILKTILVAIGFSASVINDILTFKFLKDFKISESEQKILHFLGRISLISIIIIFIIWIYTIFYNLSLFDKSFLISGSIALIIVILSETIFRRIIISKLINYRLRPQIIKIKTISILRQLAFVLNLVSVIAWFYLLLILLPLFI